MFFKRLRGVLSTKRHSEAHIVNREECKQNSEVSKQNKTKLFIYETEI